MGGDGESTERTAIVANSAVEEVSINIRCSNGTKLSIKTKLDSTVNDFKCALSQNCDVPANQQRLIYKGRILKDDQILDSYGLQADHTIHMVRGFAPSASSNPTGATVSDAATPASHEPASARREGLGAAGARQVMPPGSTFGLGGNGGSGLPGLEQMHQQMTQNPNTMREMMNMPAIQGLMNNPEIMRSLIMNNPQMREIIDRNPELAHILNDPSILRQTLETARNPELMREMMRNTDRAMSNIESSPEGFNMLRRMYENVQEPFMNATTMTGDAGNTLSGNQGAGGEQQRDGSNNPLNTGSGAAIPNTNPLPNPWSRNTGSNQTNNASRATSGDTRPTPVGGVGSLPELDLFGEVPDASMMNQFMQNPAVSQMMQSLLSNPESMNEIFNSSPQLRAMSDANPQIRELMQNPELLNQLASPEMMQQMLTLQQSLLSSLNRSQSNQDMSQTAGAGGNANNQGLEMLMNMFGGLGAGGLTTPENSNVPPEELYATQLTQLQEMGFIDTQENIRALRATHGNVHAAVERLLGNMGQ